MPIAFVLINAELDSEKYIIEQLNKIECVTNVDNVLIALIKLLESCLLKKIEVKLKKTVSTICFIDLVGYCKYTKNKDSITVFNLLNFWYTFLNEIIIEIYKNKRPFRHEIAGDGILYINNHYKENKDHVINMIEFAIKVIQRTYELQNYIEVLNI